MATQIVFVGQNKEILLESIRALRELPVGKVILVVGKDTGKENRARKIAEEVAKELKIWDVEIVEIDKEDAVRAASQLVRIIRGSGKREKNTLPSMFIQAIKGKKNKQENTILNISGSLQTFAVAAYIAACITGSRLISSIPKYNEKDEVVGIKNFIEIPVLPIDFPSEKQLEIISAIGDGVESLDELVLRLNPEWRHKKPVGYISAKALRSARSRISHQLSKLEASGFVRRTRDGRSVSIEVTELGKALIELV